MIRHFKIVIACWLSAVVFSSTLFAGPIIVPAPLQTTIADMNASDRDIPEAAPLLDIRVFSGSGAGTGIYTNQISGTAGVSGEIRTVVAGVLTQATDGITYGGLRGPTGGPLVALMALSGTLTGPNAVTFTEGALAIVEAAGTSFDARNPSSWSAAGPALGIYNLALTSVVSGPLGTAIAPVSAALMNISRGDALTLGDTDFNLLFTDALQGNFLSNYGTNNPPAMFPGIFLEGEQDLVNDTLGADINTATPGTAVLDASDLSALNFIATALGLSDLGGTLTGFATGLGASSVMSTDYYTDPEGLLTGSGSGDFFARATEANFRPVVEGVIPEPTNILVWGGLFGFAGFFRNRNRPS